ncbi:hypothetical protein NLJ89_g1669 [Agrocybe chaxingu]|uniref:Uncharacterized protein n=1 Tax=Agrocybe chaxingu TaxID=84603 RepID=A0A9W8MZM0_9AGAR|nr:hypothetical protein NLJ89_g1669 [Agrocybe chaxingu]
MSETETDTHTIVEVDRPESRLAGVEGLKRKGKDGRESEEMDVPSKVGFPCADSATSCPGSASCAPLLVGDTFTPAFPSASASSANVATAHLDANPGSAYPLLDVEVKVSTGHVKIQGQRLLWWYEVPKPGEPAREYTLEVRRRGGVLPSPEKRRKERKERRAAERALEKGQGQGKGGQQGWCEQLCPEDGGCVVM